MATTVRAIYDQGVLKLRRLLPLPPQSEVTVTIELPAGSAEANSAVAGAVVWPDILARLNTIYGPKLLAENAILAARREERY
jgi:predicted DNA-binding antitoxin AbrB/MazE fold protein